jgi:phosphonate transport system ATP-binding protein
MEILATINREDRCTVVVSLHQVEFARQYCPRVVALKEGRVVYDGTATALTNRKLAEIYGAEAHTMLLPDHPHAGIAPAVNTELLMPAAA